MQAFFNTQTRLVIIRKFTCILSSKLRIISSKVFLFSANAGVLCLQGLSAL